jgi:hypothetical protein
MNAVPITGCTRLLNKPADWDEERDGPCGSLAIRDETLHGSAVMVSAWKPSAADIAKLQAGGLVMLYVVGTIHPPCGMEVADAGQSQVH